MNFYRINDLSISLISQAMAMPRSPRGTGKDGADDRALPNYPTKPKERAAIGGLPPPSYRR